MMYAENSITKERPILDLIHVFMDIHKQNEEIFNFYMKTFKILIKGEINQIRSDNITDSVELRYRLG